MLPTSKNLTLHFTGLLFLNHSHLKFHSSYKYYKLVGYSYNYSFKKKQSHVVNLVLDSQESSNQYSSTNLTLA